MLPAYNDAIAMPLRNPYAVKDVGGAADELVAALRGQGTAQQSVHLVHVSQHGQVHGLLYRLRGVLAVRRAVLCDLHHGLAHHLTPHW